MSLQQRRPFLVRAIAGLMATLLVFPPFPAHRCCCASAAEGRPCCLSAKNESQNAGKSCCCGKRCPSVTGGACCCRGRAQKASASEGAGTHLSAGWGPTCPCGTNCRCCENSEPSPGDATTSQRTACEREEHASGASLVAVAHIELHVPCAGFRIDHDTLALPTCGVCITLCRLTT